MNDEVYQALLEASWRRKLTPDEDRQLRAYLAAHPDLQVDLEEEAVLTETLQKMPDAPLSSNFTAQVLQNLNFDLARDARSPKGFSPVQTWWRRWMPRYAAILLLGILGAVAVVQYREYQRSQLVAGVMSIAPIASIPQPEIFKDFDAIRELRHVPPASDADLLVAFQE